MIAVQEITKWDSDYQPNHIYLLDGDKIVAYIPNSHSQPIYMKGKLRLDRARRKFVELKKSPFVEVDIKSSVIKIKGSNGNTYFVDREAGTCTCPGHKFRGQCKHLN